MKIKCACGCGRFTKEGNRFINGHIWKDKHLSKEHRRKISKNHINVFGKNNPFYKKHHSEKARLKMSLAKKGKYTGKNSWMFGKENKWGNQSKEAKIKLSLANKGKNNPNWGKHPSKKTKKQQSIKRIKWIKKHPEWREQARQHCIALIKKRVRPSKFEKRIMRLIKQNYLPWKYIGDGKKGSFFGKVPDFINTNGQKAFAEAYEDRYWHDKDYVKIRRRHFAKFGFKTKFIHYKDNDEKIIRCLKE